ncbi:phage tail tip protein [Escherichia coli]
MRISTVITNSHTGTSTCRLRVTRNGQEIFNQSTTDAQGVFSSVIDMPAGTGDADTDIHRIFIRSE